MTSTWPRLPLPIRLEGGLDGLDRAHRGLAVQCLAEFEQEVVPGGDRGDIDGRL